MEIDLGCPMFQAVVVKKVMTHYTVDFYVRYLRRNFFTNKRKIFKITMHRGGSAEQRKLSQYQMAERLMPGDELYVSFDGTEWCDPEYHGALRRWWNVHFA